MAGLGYVISAMAKRKPKRRRRVSRIKELPGPSNFPMSVAESAIGTAAAALGLGVCAVLIGAEYNIRHHVGWRSPLLGGLPLNSDAVLIGAFSAPFFVAIPVYGIALFAWLLVAAARAARSQVEGAPAVRLFAGGGLGLVSALALNLDGAIEEKAISITGTLLLVVLLVIVTIGRHSLSRSQISVLDALHLELEVRAEQFPVLRTLAILFGSVLVGALYYERGPGATPPLCDLLASAAVHGTSARPTELVLYSAFQCETCASVATALARLAKAPTLRVVHRQFPWDGACNEQAGDTTIAGECQQGRAAICASTLGHGDEYRARLFEVRAAEDPALIALAESVGLPRDSFANCIASTEPDVALRHDLRLAAADGVVGTPTLVVEGQAVRRFDPDAARCIGPP